MINRILLIILITLILSITGFLVWTLSMNFRDYRYGQTVKVEGGVWDGCKGIITATKFMISFGVNFYDCPSNVTQNTVKPMPLVLLGFQQNQIEGVYLEAIIEDEK